MTFRFPKLTNDTIVQYLRAIVAAAPLDQKEIAERVPIPDSTASGYVHREGGEDVELDRSFKALAFFIEAIRSSPEAFEAVMPLLGLDQIEDPPDHELRGMVDLVKDCWGDEHDRNDLRDQMRTLRRLTGRIQRKREQEAAPA